MNSISSRSLLSVRVGRKRKSTKNRHKCGKLAQPTFDPKVIAFAMPHRQSVAPSLRHDPLAESELGRLALNKVITPEQCEAGRKYARVVGRYRAVIGAPRNGGSIAGIMEPRGGGEELSPGAARQIKSEYDGAFEALMGAGQPVAKLVARVVVHDERCARWNMSQLILGLSQLSSYYGLTGRTKRGF